MTNPHSHWLEKEIANLKKIIAAIESGKVRTWDWHQGEKQKETSQATLTKAQKDLPELESLLARIKAE